VRLVATLWLAQSSLVGQVASQSGWRYDKLNLTLSIAPERGELRILGDGDLEFNGASTSDLLLHINGDFYTLKFDSVSIPGATVEINSTDPKHKAWRMTAAHFAQPVVRGTHVPVHFEIVKDRDGFPLAVKANAAVAISDAFWYPTPDGASRDLPAGRLIFRMPVDWHVASTGTLISHERQGNENVETFDVPASRRLAFIAAPYKIHQTESPGGTNAFYQLEAPLDVASLLAVFDRGRDFLVAKYGPLPFHDYRIAEMPNDIVPWYGVSEPGLIISRNEMMTTEEGLLANIVHELAHSWWGNKVAPEGPGSLLLDEGMASFSGMSFFEATYGRERTIEQNEFGNPTGSPDATIYGYMQIWRAGKDVPISQLKDGVGDHYNISQTKGVWVLRMLSDHIGSERFYAALRQIIATHSTLTLPDFRKAMVSAASDDQSLPQFLAQWLDQPGIPVLQARWRNVTKDDKTHVVVSIFQTQPDDLFTLRIDLKLRSRKGILTRTVDLQGADTQLEFEVPDEVVGLELDPDHKLLIWRPEFGDPPMSTH
jgi:Peptidase family M1 domain